MTNQSNVTQLESLADTWDYEDMDKLGIETTDHILAAMLMLGSVVGIVGNCSAGCYFWPRRQKTIHDLQYLLIAAVDFITVLSGVPLVASLLNDRHAMLFENDLFCTGWTLIFYFTAKMSMFLVMTISVTRTISIKYPHHLIKRYGVIGAIAGYTAYMIGIYLIYFSQRWYCSRYSQQISCCTMYPNKLEMPVIAYYYSIVSIPIELFLPALATFASFVVGTWFLMTRPRLGNDNDDKFHQVSVTISIFTAVFLVSNIPCFIYEIWKIVQQSNHIDNPKFDLYGQLLTQNLSMFLNAAINPLLYLLRMPGYQKWIYQSFKNPFRVSDPVTVSQSG